MVSYVFDGANHSKCLLCCKCINAHCEYFQYSFFFIILIRFFIQFSYHNLVFGRTIYSYIFCTIRTKNLTFCIIMMRYCIAVTNIIQNTRIIWWWSLCWMNWMKELANKKFIYDRKGTIHWMMIHMDCIQLI